MINTVFENLLNEINAFDKAFNDTAAKVTVPMNIIHEEDGSSTIEVAVVGKTREDIKLKGTIEDGKSYLNIESAEKEMTEEEKAADAKRIYTLRKIKGADKLSIKIFVPANLSLKELTAKVENGLLTINIPVCAEARPVEFEIA
jgi:HSP20 family molecular chaperone IbpA